MCSFVFLNSDLEGDLRPHIRFLSVSQWEKFFNLCLKKIKFQESDWKQWILETIRSKFSHLTASGNPRFAFCGFTLSVCPYLGLKIRGCHVCFYSFVHFYCRWEIVFKVTFLWKIVQSLISERALKRNIYLKTGIVMFYTAKNLAVNHLPLESDLAVQTWTLNRKPDSKVLVTWLLGVCGSREMPKNLDLKVSTRFSKIDLKKSIENYCISQNRGWDTRHYCPFALPKGGTEGAEKRRSVEASQREVGPVIFV